MYSRDDWEDLLNSVAEDHAAMIRQLLASEERLRAAVQFYADPANWVDSPDWDGHDTSTPKSVPVSNEPGRPCDCGDIAREALK